MLFYCLPSENVDMKAGFGILCKYKGSNPLVSG